MNKLKRLSLFIFFIRVNPSASVFCLFVTRIFIPPSFLFFSFVWRTPSSLRAPSSKSIYHDVINKLHASILEWIPLISIWFIAFDGRASDVRSRIFSNRIICVKIIVIYTFQISSNFPFKKKTLPLSLNYSKDIENPSLNLSTYLSIRNHPFVRDILIKPGKKVQPL